MDQINQKLERNRPESLKTQLTTKHLREAEQTSVLILIIKISYQTQSILFVAMMPFIFGIFPAISADQQLQFVFPCYQAFIPAAEPQPSLENYVIAQEQSFTSKNEKQEEKAKEMINLTKEDLISAGYDNCKKLWTQEEDSLLLRRIDVDLVPWKQIQSHLQGRTEKMCYSRYRRLISQTKQTWTKEEDEKLKSLVSEYGQAWKQFIYHFVNRNSKQLKDRYLNYLRPEIKRDQWSMEEDLKIIEMINKYGKRWKLIEKELGNRTDNQIKNRYYGRLKLLLKQKMIKSRKIKRSRATTSSKTTISCQ